jgi:hypothetical protein
MEQDKAVFSVGAKRDVDQISRAVSSRAAKRQRQVANAAARSVAADFF